MQITLVPPPLPSHTHPHGPVPVTVVAVPLLHRPVAGFAACGVWDAGPHTPFTTVTARSAWHDAVVPPLLPAQLQVHGPVPRTFEAVPAEHKLAVGAVETVVPFAEPHAPVTGVGVLLAEHCAVVPPLLPVQFHVHGPVPLTAEAVPVEQRLVVGMLPTVIPLALPQAPLTGVGVLFAEHCAVVPPLLPAQFHAHGPVPVMAEAVPVLQRLVVGALLTVVPFALPHWPFDGNRWAVQITSAPPPLPSHTHPHGPVPVTVVAVPLLHRPVVGFAACGVWDAGPHTPFTTVTARSAWHDAVVPPFDPAQLHVQGPVPRTFEAVPAEHKLAVGTVETVVPLALPHAPLTGAGVLLAEHCAVVPPLLLMQLQFHGPVPLMVEAVPVLHRLEVGAVATVVPLALPHTPFTGAGVFAAEHCAVVPPFDPAQLHVHGPVPVTTEAVPVEQRLVVGMLLTVVPLALPQTPLIATGVDAVFAEQDAVVPCFLPVQLHVHGPVPVTAEAVPALQRSVAGAPAKVAPSDDPHTPLTACLFAKDN